MKRVYVVLPFLSALPLLWSGVGALRRDPRATETEPRKRGGGTRDPEGEREIVGTPSGREDGGRTKRTRVERTGENWTKGRGRKGKETGGSGEEAEEKRNRTGNGENQNRGRGTIPRRYAWKGEENEPGSGVRNEVERTGENRTQGRGRKRSATKGLSEASNRSIRSLRSLPGETRALGPGGHPDPAEYAGGEAPPCAEPPAAPTCTAKYVIGPPSQHYNHCGASRSLRTDFKERENRRQSRGPIMSSARTQWVNCSSLRRPSSSALWRRVVSLAWAFFAIFAALS